MPTIYFVSPPLRAAAAGLSLALCLAHRVALPPDNASDFSVNHRLPESVDVLSSSDITFSLCGSLDRIQVLPEKLQNSALVHHLLTYLRMHSEELGLSHISRVYIDVDGLLKFTVSSAHALLHPDHSPTPIATLIALDLTFSWKSSVSDNNESFLHPFSPQLLLPIQSTLNTILGKLSRDLVRRYPLIFGTWRNFLDAETVMFPHICRSILDIIHRSPNASFRRISLRLIKTLRKRNSSVFSTSLTELENLVGPSVVGDVEITQPLDVKNETVLSLSMQRLYRSFVRPPRFKCFATVLPSEDDDFEFSSLTSDSQKDLTALANVTGCREITHSVSHLWFSADDPFLDSTDKSLLVVTPTSSTSGILVHHSQSEFLDLDSGTSSCDEPQFSDNPYIDWSSDEDICNTFEQALTSRACDLDGTNMTSLDHAAISKEQGSSPITKMDGLDLRVPHPQMFHDKVVWRVEGIVEDNELLDFGDG